MDREQIHKLDPQRARRITREHLELGPDECRWCFAVDMERVKGKEIARHSLSDATVLYFSCPRCGGEYSLCSNGFDDSYLKGIIHKLHPELDGQIDDIYLNEIIGRVLYIDDTGKYLES